MGETEKTPVIQTAGLTKKFRDFWGHNSVTAVDNLDLEIYQGEVFGLLGPNGSGKSTTINMLLGLLFPTHGAISVLGKPPGDVKTNHRIGFLPEESYLYPYLNARETLDFYGRIFGLRRPERRKRIDSLLDMVGLIGIPRRKPMREYSKGMKRRIGLAQALINDPDLLILDEPTSGLDPPGTREIKDLIYQLGQRGKTVLLCSHLLADVEDVCDRIGILHRGKLRELGTMNELLCLQETTRIRCKRLSPQTIEKIKSTIQDDQIEVDAPRERLEDYFMRIIKKAQAQDQADQVEATHAMIGSGISDFLTGSDPQPSAETDVIEQLVSADEPENSDPAAITTAIPDDQPRRDMLESLVGTQSNPSEPLTVSVDPSSSDGSKEQPRGVVDHSVLNELTAKSGGAPTDPQTDQPSGQQESSGDSSANPTKHSDHTSAERGDE